MAQIVTITNPLTGQPAQVDQLDHTAQEIDDGIGFESTDYPGCYYRMVDGVIEWVNPPMELGVEYRTTERYQGQPVYVKAVNFGALPNGELKIVAWDGANKPNIPIAYGGTATKGSAGTGTLSIPMYWDGDSINIGLNSYQVWIKTETDRSAFNATVWIKYYKTTD